MPKRCNVEIEKTIAELIKNGLTNTQIAEKSERSRSTIANIVKRKFNGNPNYIKIHDKRKEKDLYRKCLEFFLDHTFKETADKFKLTDSELKSVFTYAYKMPHLSHLRKDTRRRDAWTIDETLALIRMSGLVDRRQIGKILNRSKNYQGIKDRLKLLGIKSRNVNGLTLTQYRSLFNEEPIYSIRTKAGSGGMMKVILVPWVSISNSTLKNQPEFIIKMISAMTKFQLWIWSEKSKKKCLDKIETVVK